MFWIKDLRIFDDDMSNAEIIRSLVNSENIEDPFQLMDAGDIVAKHTLWCTKIPRVVPHFAVKCNPDPTVIKVLAQLGGCFDCASKNEIIQVMEYGVPGNRIIYAHPIKAVHHLLFAKKVGVERMTADCEMELRKIRKHYPEAKVVLRFRCDANSTENSEIDLGPKFGFDPDYEAAKLIHITKDLGLDLHGFSFHVGSPCFENMAYRRGLLISKKLIEFSKSIGFKNVQLIDIGGGIPGSKKFDFDSFAKIINETLDELDPSIKVISEPGRFYVESAFTAVAAVIGKKPYIENNEKKFKYYLNDGCYGSFVEELLQLRSRLPVIINRPVGNEKYTCTLWGPTCDSFDCILKDVSLPELYVGEWLMWNEMGAYGLALATSFNGFKSASVFPVIRRSSWNALLTKLNNADKTSAKKIEQNGYRKNNKDNN